MGKESEKEEVYVYVLLNHFSGVLVHLKLTQHCKSIIVIQLLSHIWLFANPWTAARQASLSSTISQSLLKFMSIESVMLSISTSPAPFSFCLQPFPASRSFPVSWLFASGGQSIGASALASFLPVNIQGWFPLGLISLISLLSRGLSYSANSPLIQCKSPVMC